MKISSLLKPLCFISRSEERVNYLSAIFGATLSIAGFYRTYLGLNHFSGPTVIFSTTIGLAGVGIFVMATWKVNGRESMPVSKESSIPNEKLKLSKESSIPKEKLKPSKESLIPKEKLKPSKESSIPKEKLKPSKDTILKFIREAFGTIGPKSTKETLALFENYEQQRRTHFDLFGLRKGSTSEVTSAYVLMFGEIWKEIEKMESNPLNPKDLEGQNRRCLTIQEIICRHMPKVDISNKFKVDDDVTNLKSYPIEVISYSRLEKALEYLMENNVSITDETDLKFRKLATEVRITHFKDTSYYLNLCN